MNDRFEDIIGEPEPIKKSKVEIWHETVRRCDDEQPTWQSKDLNDGAEISKMHDSPHVVLNDKCGDSVVLQFKNAVSFAKWILSLAEEVEVE